MRAHHLLLFGMFLLAVAAVGCPRQPKPSTKSMLNLVPKLYRFSPAKLGRQIQARVNQVRLKYGLKPLQWDTPLQKVALEHSQNMAKNNYFSHTNDVGESPMQRGFRAGLRCARKLPSGLRRTGIGENLFQNHLYSAIIYRKNGAQRTQHYRWSHAKEIVATTVRGWLNSPSHRHNMLSQHYTHGGVGVAISADGKVYITHNFC